MFNFKNMSLAMGSLVVLMFALMPSSTVTMPSLGDTTVNMSILMPPPLPSA